MKNSTPNLKNPIFVALDVDDQTQAMRLAEQISPFVGGFKVGPRLILRYGPQLIAELGRLGPVFVDLKFHDIPSTVLSAVESAFVAGASFVTVHASNGPTCLQELAALEQRLAAERSFRVLAVTVLTSFAENNLPSNWRAATIAEHVEALADEVLAAGLHGLVCSPHEVAKLRARFSDAYLVTPGIRPVSEGAAAKDDQARTLTPDQALKAGANALVIGRPIVAAKNPAHAAQAIARSIV